MTCKDCKHYGEKTVIDDKIYHLCTDSGDLILTGEEDEECGMCLFFEPKEDSWESVSK